MKFIEQHDNALASIQFRNAVKLKKDLLPAWQQLAEIEELNQNYDDLITILRSVVELAPNDNAAKLRLATLLQRAGSFDEALTLVNAANRADLRNADALALKALILLRQKDTANAIAEARGALEIDPRNSGALIVLASERFNQGEPKAALEILDTDPKFHAKDLGIQLFKLLIFRQTQDWRDFESLLKAVIDDYPEELAFRKELVRLYVSQRRIDDAEKAQRAIVSAHPTDSQAVLELVRFLYASRGPGEAQQELRRQMDGGGEIFPYQMALAEVDFKQGNIKDGVGLLESLVSANSSPEHVLAARVALAEMYLSKKDINAAETLASDILGKDSRNSSGLQLRASIRMERGELEPAINDLRQALNDEPRSIRLMMLLATAYERSGSIELAEKQLADAMRASDFNPRVGLDYVAFLRRRGNAERAESVTTELSGRWPKNVQILSALAEMKLMRQDFVGAQEVAESIRQIGSDQGIGGQILGASLIGRNKYNESIGVLQDAYASSPSAAQPLSALVKAYVNAKQTDKAVAFLQSVLKTSPKNVEAYILLGSLQLASNAPDQALKSYNAAIESQPNNIMGYRALASYYVSQNKFVEAQKAIRGGLIKQPDSPILHLILGGLLEQTGDYEAAISEFQYAVDKDPNSLVASNNLASLLADHRADKASLERAYSLAAVLRKSPVATFKDTLGWVTYQRGDYKAAIPLLEEAVVALPKMALVHFHLGMAYVAVNEPAKASEQLQGALGLTTDGELKEKIQAGLKEIGSL
jgi:tetratricopeptide (TPR) repeat protein